ncbi:protein-disulfide reductase DsbD [Stenotrophomonas sp. YIM B06876]|uniref:protein-disulfide reductase DsbD family protein n=1 Tax=Stenotrophomonas sp. YIM B06876 TaxID=3060211 RepID=UPI0027385408|nr:protein-disulfide reductase DsbD [Stenotrophomonas sp. YIM B06876]
MKSLLRRFAALCLLSSTALPALAVNEKDLLPVDQAFALQVQAPSRDRIELQWQIAPGYYLYRHRTSARVEAGFEAGALQLPGGEKKHDEFFGDVETYHRQLTAVLPGTAAATAGTLRLEVRYQGCADAGVCYPPQKRMVEVKLPPAMASASVAPAAFNPLARTDNGGLRLPGTAATQNLPLPSDQAFGFEAIADGGNRLLLRFSPAPGYYLYRDRSSFALEGASGIRTGKPQWPAGSSHRDEHFGNVVVYFDQVDVPLPLRRERAEGGDVTLVTTFQGCQTDGICYPPMTRRVKLALPAGTVSPTEEATVASLVIPPLPSGKRGSTGAVLPAPAQPLITRSSAPPDPAADAAADNGQRSRPPAAQPEPALPAILLLALLGGLVLNLMPCVLPILSLKVLGVAQSGESRQRARRHALWYTLGVLVAFTAIGAAVIALRAAGQAAGWGFQLQQPWFIAALVYLMFAVGLSLSGVFTLGGNLGGVGQSLAGRSGPLGDFFTGVLACVVASPCIAPFMGPALAYAFTAPAALAMLVFLGLGLGLALPFLLIGFMPALARRLPKPGAWMETLKQVLAFPMYLTAIWLLWVLGKQRGVDAIAMLLVGATALALGLWCFERSRWRNQRPGMLFGAVLVALALVPAWGVTRLEAPSARGSEGAVLYSPQMLDRLRADNRVVFVNMTADWCVTCKANERSVLGSATFQDTLKRVDAVYMRGDWTNVDPQISAFLEEHKAVGVPLYVVYGPGTSPKVLPTVLNQAIVEDALLRAAR